MKSWDLHVCDRASTITHVDRVKKSNPWYNKIWLCLNVTIWSSPICLCYFHSFCYSFKISGKKITLLSITRHCLSLFLVGSKSMLALLLFKATITPRHWNDKCFHRAGGDLICRFGICASHFQCIVGAQQEILCLTVRTTSWFDECDHGVSECQSLHDSDTVKSSKWKKVRWKLNIWLLRRHLYTISVTWPHCGTVHDFFGSFNWPRLPSWIGFFTARWQWQHVRAARARSSKQNTRANISVFCLQIWPSIKSWAINCFNKCVFGFYSHWKVWYKSEKAFGMCSEWHFTTRGLAYGDMTTRPTGSLSCLHPPIALVV